MGTNTTLILQLLLIAAEQTQKWTLLVMNANAAGRDVTDEEKAQASADYDSMHAQLDKALGK